MPPDNPGLRALALVCTLSHAPISSSSELIAAQVLEELEARDVSTSSVRVVDLNIAPGVDRSMSTDDDWPGVLDQVLDADILVISTPTWLGHMSSVAQRVLERLDAEISRTAPDGRPTLFDRVAIVAVVGNEDGAHKVVADLMQALNDVGFTIPAQGCTYWNGAAMERTDYQDLDKTPAKVTQTNATAAQNAVHLARLLRAAGYPVNA